jgi:hypothetical protein
VGAGARRAWTLGAVAAGVGEVVRAAGATGPDVGVAGGIALALVGVGLPLVLGALTAPALRKLHPAVAAWASFSAWTGTGAWVAAVAPPQGLAPWPHLEPATALMWLACWVCSPLVTFRPWVALAVSGGLVAAVTAWPWLELHRAPPAAGPSVLVVTVDALRPDLLPQDGWFAALNRRGLRLDRAVAASPVVGAATAAWLTGRGPWETGHYSDGLVVQGPTVASTYREAGYRTAAFVSSDLVGPELGFGTGFDVMDADGRMWPRMDAVLAGRILLAAGLWSRPPRRAAPYTIDAAEAWIRGQTEPWFVWVHLEDPVGPYAPGDPWDQRYTNGLDPRGGLDELLPLRPLGPEHGSSLDRVHDKAWVVGQYQGEVALVEHHLERLARAVPPETRWVVAGTTGEALGEGLRGFTHGVPQPSEIQVPIWLVGAGVTGRYPWPFESTDLAGVLSAWAGAPVQPDPWAALQQGKALRPFARSAAAPDGIWATTVSSSTAVWARPTGLPVVIANDGTPGTVLHADDALGRAARATTLGVPPRTRRFSASQLHQIESLGGSPPPP